jgi:hypothetical protein
VPLSLYPSLVIILPLLLALLAASRMDQPITSVWTLALVSGCALDYHARIHTVTLAARELVEKRDAWLNPPGASQAELKKRTLTNLYNQRPTWLDLAHRKLDEAVLDAYGWPHELSDEEILERLLALNLERAAVEV